MRVHARWALGLFSLVVALPAWVKAGPVDGNLPASAANSYQPAQMPNGYQPAPIANSYQPAPMASSYQPAAMPGSYPQPAMPTNNEVPSPHRHKGLFGWRHCVECQRAHAKLRYGVDVPPPPSFTPGMAMQGQVVSGAGTRCATCEGAVVSGQPVVVDPRSPGYTVVGGPTVMAGAAPGYAVVGGNVASSGAPGYAVVGGAAAGAEPSPIGVARAMQPQWGNPSMAANGPHPGATGYDPAVMPSSVPPAQVAIAPPGHDHPHIIRHVLNLPTFGEHRREREERAREKHAAIAYDQPNASITELPASMVYGTKGH